ncbi:class II aldolase [Prolixibacteraceae bacterium JC049]|nr:class II aldolase [Prolixibacteraceae bacterium JC049]
MKEHIKSLLQMAHEYGQNSAYVIAGGGNISYKTSDKLWVKASGTSMSTLAESDLVSLSREKLDIISKKQYSDVESICEQQVKEDLNAAIIDETGKRPSVETSLHNLMNFPFVVHTHPILVNSLMCSKNAQSLTEQLFPKALYIEYTNPGYTLFKKIEERIKQFREANNTEAAIIFLRNHGVFVGTNSQEEVNQIYKDIDKQLINKLSQDLPLIEEFKFEAQLDVFNNFLASKGLVSCTRKNTITQLFCSNAEQFAKVSLPFTPDDIVYCKSSYIYCISTDDLIPAINEFESTKGYLPKVAIIENEGIIAIEDSEKSAQTVLDIFENMMKVSYLSNNWGGPQFMTPEQISFIDNWEVENYRRKMAKQ